MKTIQFTDEEDREIAELKVALHLPNKKEVVREGLRSLRELVQARKRSRRLQKASQLVATSSQEINEKWAPLATPLRKK